MLPGKDLSKFFFGMYRAFYIITKAADGREHAFSWSFVTTVDEHLFQILFPLFESCSIFILTLLSLCSLVTDPNILLTAVPVHEPTLQ